jgi:hypothetical protein
MRERGNELAPVDGFAAGPVAPRQGNQALQDNSAAAHMTAILNSGLTDEIDDETAYGRAMADRITDNFGHELAAYRRRREDGFANAPTEDHAERLEGPRMQQFGGAINRGGNLPAVAQRNNALAAHDPNAGRNAGYMTDWLQLRRGGAYLVEQVRSLGRDIFAQYAPGVEIEDLNMIGFRRDMQGGGPVFHSQEFVRSHIRWITEAGQEITTDTIDFGRNIPGYQARVSLWEVDHFNFLIVADNHGEYAYGWPAPPRPRLAPPTNVPRLR